MASLPMRPLTWCGSIVAWTYRSFVMASITVIVFSSLGCDSENQIRSYDIPKPKPLEASNETSEGGSVPTLQYTKPEGWQEAAPDGFSQLAFQTTEGDQSLRITVSLLGGDGGGVIANVKRWRNQVGAEEMNESSLEKEVEPFSVQDVSGHYVEAVGSSENSPAKAIFGWIGIGEGHCWFVKMRGEAELAKKNRDAFRTFLKSLQFETPPRKAENGN